MILEDRINETSEVPVLIFQLEWEQFAIELLEIKEIIQAGQIRKLPKSLEFIEGIYNYRGNIIHIVNLKKKLRLNEYALYKSKIKRENNTNNSAKKFFMILDISNKDIGVIVDQIINMEYVNPRNIEGLSPIFQTNLGIEYIKGIIKFKDRPRILVDMRKMLKEVKQQIIEK